MGRLSEIPGLWKRADELTQDQACQTVAWVFSGEGREWTSSEVGGLTHQSERLLLMWLRCCDIEIADMFGHAGSDGPALPSQPRPAGAVSKIPWMTVLQPK